MFAYLRKPGIITSIVATLGLGLSTFLAHNHEKEREHLIPLAFSEINQIEREAQQREISLSPMNTFLPKLNDAEMKIFEAWNISHGKYVIDPEAASSLEGKHHIRFAKALSKKMEQEEEFRYSLATLLEELPELSQQVQASLSEKGYMLVHQRSDHLVDLFSRIWAEKHDDDYRTEFYTEEEEHTDANGNTYTTIETKTRQVYDHTDHTYTYFPQIGNQASQTIDDLLQRQPVIRIDDRIYTASQIKNPNRLAMRLSRENQKEKERSDQDLLLLANTWKTSSTMLQEAQQATQWWNDLHQSADEWRGAKSTAASVHYRTNSRSDSGPREYQISRRSLNQLESFRKSLHNATEGLIYTEQQALILSGKIQEYITKAFENDNDPGLKMLRSDIMEITRTMYKKNFQNGFDVDRYRGMAVFLWALLGTMIGAGIGGGFEYGSNRLFPAQEEKLGRHTHSSYRY